jgi:hypothetical protein
MVQQQTPSHKISQQLRLALGGIRRVISHYQGQSLFRAGAAKLPLESDTDPQPDQQLEVGTSPPHPAATLCAIRRKWEEGQGLARAEWVLLAHYVQIGCQAVDDHSALPSRESFTQMLEAFLAVRALRADRCMGESLDGYYSLKLMPDVPLQGFQTEDLDAIPRAVALIVGELRQPTAACRPSYACRCLSAAGAGAREGQARES